MDIQLLKKIILDVDGVLLDTCHHHITELLAVAEALGIEKPPMKMIKKYWARGFQDFLENIFPGLSLEEFVQRSKKLGFRKNTPPRIPGTRRAFSLLAEHYSLSIVSNRSEPSLTNYLRGAEFNMELFRFVQSASDLPREFHKPSPVVFSRILSVLHAEGIRPKEVVYVGDSEIDFEATDGAGMNFVGVTAHGLTTPEDFLRIGVPKENLLETVRELPGFLGIEEE